MAGRMERKPYGLELYRAVSPRDYYSASAASKLVRCGSLDFESAAELIAQRDRTAPGDRHFFCDINAAGTRIESVKLRQWNTYGEILGLREFLKSDMPRSVMAVSTGVHLRRVAATFGRVFRDVPLEARYCPVPSLISSVRKEEWWSSSPGSQVCAQ